MTDLTAMPHSAVDSTDPAFLQAIEPMGGDLMCAYLMAMAAWQRGLRVEFFGNQTDAALPLST